VKTGWLLYNGFATNNNSIFVTGRNTHNAPERDVTTFQIAGRNGDFFVDNGRWQNIEVTYPCFVTNFSAHEQEIRNGFGVPRNNYATLEDNYDTDHFRLARLIGGITFEPFRGNIANFELTFDCDPRRFLQSGKQEEGVIAGALTIENPTPFASKPAMYVRGFDAGMEITVTDGNGKTYTMTATDALAGGVTIDSEAQDIYEEVDDGVTITRVNRNSLFTLSNGFPVFTEGENTISVTGAYDYIGVRPMWWEL
jgi:phage-related protein